MNFKDLTDARQKYERAQDDMEEIVYGWSKNCGDNVESASILGRKGLTHPEVSVNKNITICGSSVHNDSKTWRYVPSTQTLFWWEHPNDLEIESAMHELRTKWDIQDEIFHKDIHSWSNHFVSDTERDLSQAISHGTFLVKPHKMPSFREYLKYHNSHLYNHIGD